jgi:ParB family chromosome partitioning protein
MPKDKKIDFGLPTLDEIFTPQEDLFSTQAQRDDAKLKRIYEIPLDQIDPFPDHPFKVKDDEDMMNLVESVKENGVITPATVRKKEDGRYEMLSGHRRLRACELAGLPTLRCDVVEMTKDEATIFMVESNFQRSKILPSEKAFAYKMRLEAMKHQGARSDLTSAPVERKSLEARDYIGKDAGESREQVRRYIRLTELIPELLERVDEGEIALRPAVELSYISKDLQRSINDSIEMEQATPSHAQAIRMRKMQEEGKLTPESIEAIMTEEKPNQKERIVFRGERIAKLFPKDLPVSRREDFMAAALEYYNRYLERKKNDRER